MFGKLARVNVILTCTSCTGSSTSYSILDDSPVIIPELPAGNYTAKILAVDKDVVLRTVKVFTVSDNIVTATTNTPTNNATDTTTNTLTDDATDTTTNTPTDDATDTTTNTPTNDVTDTTTYTPSTESIPHK